MRRYRRRPRRFRPFSPSWAGFRFSGSRLASCSICFGLISFDKSWLAPGIGMSLTLAMLRCPDDVAPETRTVAGGEFSIGRAPENDWVLPDPERALSKRHCVLTFLAGGWQVADHLDQRHVSEPRGRADRPRSKPRAAQRRPALVRRLRDRGACRGGGAGAAPDRTGGPVRGASLGDARIVRARSVRRRLRAGRTGVRPGSAAGRRGRA